MSASAPAEAGPDFGLAGRTALVTGAGRGLGRSIALALTAAGADVGLLSRTEADLQRVASEVGRLGGNPLVVPCDVTDAARLREAIAALPALDIVVAGAGTNVPQPFPEVDEQTFDRVVEINLRAAFFTAQAAVQRMIADTTAGCIVFISSQMGHVGAPNRSVYCASKHAIEGLTRALAVELAPTGIRVNSIAPTYIRTPMTEPFLADAQFRRSATEAIPLRRIGEPDDVTGAVVFLASPAARLVTGHSLVIDGGYTAQ